MGVDIRLAGGKSKQAFSRRVIHDFEVFTQLESLGKQGKIESLSYYLGKKEILLQAQILR